MTIFITCLILTLTLTAEQVFDVFSTTQALKRTGIHEANQVIAWLMARLGHFWWAVKLVVVIPAWVVLLAHPEMLGPKSVIGLAVIILLYAWVLWNNYKLAWRN